MRAGSSRGEVIRWPEQGWEREPGGQLRRRGQARPSGAEVIPLPRPNQAPAPRWGVGRALALALAGVCVLAVGVWILVH
jgi:hypothetical protein